MPTKPTFSISSPSITFSLKSGPVTEVAAPEPRLSFNGREFNLRKAGRYVLPCVDNNGEPFLETWGDGNGRRRVDPEPINAPN